MKLMRTRCATCIFGPGNPMSLTPGTVATMVATCRLHDVHIPCHERMTPPDSLDEVDFDDQGHTHPTPISLEDPVCRGFYDACPGVGQVLRIAARLGALLEVS